MLYSVGIDPSLTGLGLVAIPETWGCDLHRVRTPEKNGAPAVLSTDSDDGPLPARRLKLAGNVVKWIDWLRRRPGVEVEVWMEGGIAFGRDIAKTLRSQERIAGAVEDALYRDLGIECMVAEQSAARKLLLGYLPFRDKKQAVVEVLAQLRPDLDHNVYDAICAANFGLYARKRAHLADLAPPRPAKPKRERRKVALPRRMA